MKLLFRYLGYMFLHANLPHLLPNIGIQILLSFFAVQYKSSQLQMGNGSNTMLMMQAHLRVLFVYFSAILISSIGYYLRNPEGTLIGCSAGVFGLAGICLIDAFNEAIIYLKEVKTASRTSYEIIMMIVRFFIPLLLVFVDILFDEDDESKIVHLIGLISGSVLGIVWKMFECCLTKFRENVFPTTNFELLH